MQIESREYIGDDTKLITVSIVAMLVLATVTGWSCRPCACAYNSHVTLAYMGVVAALLAILGAFGLLSLIGSHFVNLSSVMPFLVLGIINLLTYLLIKLKYYYSAIVLHYTKGSLSFVHYYAPPPRRGH